MRPRNRQRAWIAPLLAVLVTLATAPRKAGAATITANARSTWQVVEVSGGFWAYPRYAGEVTFSDSQHTPSRARFWVDIGGTWTLYDEATGSAPFTLVNGTTWEYTAKCENFTAEVGSGPVATKDQIWYWYNDGTSGEGDAGYSAVVNWSP